MKRSWKKVVVFVLATVMSVLCVGCGNTSNPNANNPDALHIRVFDGGYSTSWLTQIAKSFEKDTGIPVDIKPPVSDTSGWVTEIDSGESKIDLYFGNTSGMDYAVKDGLTIGGQKYSTYLADLTDMYNTKVPGEDILYKDKLIASVRDAANFDLEYDNENKIYNEKSDTGKFYTANWANGSLSFVVNMEAWDSSWGEFPKTTDKMFELCEKIISGNAGKSISEMIYPFVYSISNSYWPFIFETWAYQYMGKDEYQAYINGYDESGNRFTKELLRYEGFLESLETIEECLKARGKDNIDCYSYPYSTSIDFTTSQFYLLNGKGIMQPNGNWIIGEMAANYKNAKEMDIRFEKVPVISSIRDRCQTIEDDDELAALVTAIDEGSEALVGEGYDVSREDFDRVFYARRLVITMGNTHGAFVPAYAKNIDKAKEFLLYMAKDSSLEIYYEETMGSTLPFNYDYSNSSYEVSRLIQSERDMLSTADVQPYSMSTNSKYRFFSQTGFNGMYMPYVITSGAETYFSAVNEADRKSAQEIFDDNYEYALTNWNQVYAPYSWD